MILKNKLILSICMFGAGMTASAVSVASVITVLPSFDEFNRSVNAGSEIGLGILYKKQKTDRLLHGMEAAGDTGWESHSTLTTGLFPLATGKRLVINYMVRSGNTGELGSTLWTEVRYFNKQGVNIEQANGNAEAAPANWSQRAIILSPQKPSIAYAEIWFVKYENVKNDDEEKSYGKELGIYIADIKIQ